MHVYNHYVDVMTSSLGVFKCSLQNTDYAYMAILVCMYYLRYKEYVYMHVTQALHTPVDVCDCECDVCFARHIPVCQLGLFMRALRPARTGLRPARFTRALPE